MQAEAVDKHRVVYISVKDDKGEVSGRAEAEIHDDGRIYLLLQQTYGGSTDGTLKGVPVRCDLSVLEAMVALARKVGTR